MANITRPSQKILDHIKRYPYESTVSAAATLGRTKKTLATCRWFVRKYEGVDLPKTDMKKHAEQVAREGYFPPDMPRSRKQPKTNMLGGLSHAQGEPVTIVNFGKPAPEREPEGVHDAEVHINTIDYIKGKLTSEEFVGYCKGNAMKAISRSGKKSHPEEALRIAKWYLDQLLDVREGDGTTP